MFSASRVVAIDDQRGYLDQLCSALHRMGIPCVPIHYPGEVPGADAGWFRNVRIAFCDLHLLEGVTKSELNYPAVGALLERMISPAGGPLLLILWTAYPKDADALTKYLAARHADAQPVAVLPLDKADFQGASADRLPQAIRDRLDAIPQLRALLEWEDDVANAGHACVGALLRLAVQDGGELKDSLDTLLSSLAQAATGKEIAALDPGSALQEVLVPMLADRLSHLPDDANRLARWKLAMPKAVQQAKCSTTKSRAAAINTALSVVHAAGGLVTGRERGAVVEIVCPSLFMYRFSSTEADVLKKFALKNAPAYRWVAIQVEAICDFAQQKSPSLPYILAVEIPAAAELVSRNERPISLWESPVFLSEQNTEVRLVANVQFASMISPRKAKSFSALYRLREPLVNELAFCKTRHESRPGIVALY